MSIRLLLVPVIFAGCVPSTAPVESELALRRDVLHALHTEVVAAGYADLTARSAVLSDAASAFCTAPDAAGLEAVRTAWLEARTPWKQLEVVGFGPVVDEPYRFGPLLDFWPVRETVVDDLLASEAPVGPADVATFGASTRGFPVLDYLLWGPGEGSLDAFVASPRRCTYVASLSADLHTNAAALEAAWVAYAPALEDPAAAGTLPYADTQEVVDEWVNRMLFTIDDIRAEKLGKPLGDSSGGVPLTDAVESRYSGRSLRDTRDAFAGVERLFEGEPTGFQELMPDSRTPIGFFEDFAERRRLAREALEAIPETLEESVVAAPDRVVAAQDALREVQVSIQVDMAQALGVTLAFNDNDGD
ncbi:MAG: imelysin family protein [Myxococcota bacterium]